MDPLNLPAYSFKIRTENQKSYIFDSIRKKHVLLTPEEWVRQNFIRFLNEEKHYPLGLIAVETPFKINRLTKRSDIVVFKRDGNPWIMVECKAPQVEIAQKVIDQIARYTLHFKASFLIVTNGLQHYCLKLDQSSQKYTFIKEIPDYENMIESGIAR
ncbi:MAG: type I restriction enzyme HsdR N-terminal domain-containing protein [Bacteroidota bacterium]|nr:type I restriction enzyme HsdR N-terminal domain-containing protein [Bacteroidota bacterium]MDP4274502.1 type I restriction enzyme HsdR N-terminal domain-containing protein [Bacteroidota bacterium]